MKQEQKMNQVEKMNEKREINDFYQPPPTAGFKSSQQAIPVWRSERNGFGRIRPAHLEWSAGEQGSSLMKVMNDRNNILAKIEELKYAAECLEDLINNWEKKTIKIGD